MSVLTLGANGFGIVALTYGLGGMLDCRKKDGLPREIDAGFYASTQSTVQSEISVYAET